MKKLISTLLLLTILLQLFAATVLAEDNTDAEYRNTMESFGVISSDKSMSGQFTIAEMSEMIYNLLNVTDDTVPEATRQIYTDVDRWHWAAGYIEWLYDNRIYTGDGSGIYEPDRNAKLSDVCTVALNLLGYTDMMENINDNTNVVNKAIQIGLISSKVSKVEHEVTYDEFASICYELLFTNVIEPVYSVKKAYSKGGEFVTEVLDIVYDKGVLTGANGYSFSGVCDTEEIVIGGVRYDIPENADYTDYLGYRVKYYYAREAEIIVSVIPLKNEEMTINSADIKSYINGVYTYKCDEKLKTEKCENVMLLYNGKTTTNRNAFQPAYGRVRLIDNDGDGRYECIISENAVNVVLENVVDGIIYGKNADTAGKKYTFDTDDYELVRFVGNSADLEELKPNTIISAVISEDGEYATFYVSEEKTTGVLDGFDDGKIIVAGTKYEMAVNMYNPSVITSPGCTIEVGIDVFGNVALIAGTSENQYLFGYLMSVMEDTMENKLILKIMTEEGGILRLYTSDKLVIDGTRMENINASKNNLKTDELIRYRVSGGEIRFIDTAVQNSGFSDYSVTSDRNALTMIAKCDAMLYKAGPRIFKKFNTAMDVYAEFGVNDDTVVFFVPKDDTNADENDYYVGTISSLSDDMQPGVQAYVTSKDAMIAEAVVVKYTTGTSMSTAFTIVEKVYKAADEDNEIVGRIKGLCNGNEVDIVVPDLSLITNIGKGSVIRYKEDRNGKVREIQNIYSINGSGEVNKLTSHSWTSGATGVNANVRAVLGSIYDKNGTFARFQFKDGASADEMFNLKNCNFYVYDTTLRTGTVDDIYDYKHYSAKYDEVIICTRAVSVCDVFLIRK